MYVNRLQGFNARTDTFGSAVASPPLDGLSPSGAFSFSRQLLTAYGGAFYTDIAGAITTFYDQALTGDATDSATAGFRPTLSTAGPNSKACGDFDGSSDVLTGPDLSSYVTDSSKFIIVSAIFDDLSTGISASFATIGHTLVSDESGRSGLFGGTYAAVTRVWAANYDGGASDDHIGQIIAIDTAYVITLRHESNVLYVSVNGAAETSVASGATSGAMGVLRFGFRTGAAYFNGKLFECALFSTIPSAGDRTTLIADFMDHVGAV